MEQNPLFFKQFFKQALIKHLPTRMIDPLISDGMFSSFGRYTARDLRHWRKVSAVYLTPHEKLAMAIILTNEGVERGQLQYNQLMGLGSDAICGLDNPNDRSVGQLLLGVLSLEQALLCRGIKQRKLLRLAAFYFSEAAHVPEFKELALAFSAILNICLGEWEQATRSFVRYSKNTTSPEGAWYILSKMYHYMDLPRVALFYHRRYQRSFNIMAA